MEYINFLINPKVNRTCLLCFSQNESPTNIYSDFEIENKYFRAILKLEDMIKYLFPEFDITFTQACQSCTDLIMKMYINIRKNKIIKTLLINLITAFNLELEKQTDTILNHCHLNINKSKLEIIKDTSDIFTKTFSPCNNEIKDINIEKQCQDCFKYFNNVKMYKLHIKTHKRKPRRTYHFCNKCEYKTLSKSSLQGHINKNHLKVRQFVCHICFKSFYHKKNLIEHQQIHTRGRDEVCEVCGDTFLHRKNLLEHLRLHNDDRPYECEICGKKFITSGRRLDHIKRSHTDKSEVCLLCDKKFSLQKELARHIKTVHS